MRHHLFASAALAAGLAAVPAVAQTVTLQVTHPQTGRFAAILPPLEVAFEAAHPDIDLVYTGVGDNWEPVVQNTLSRAITGNLPDVSHQAINYLRLYVSRGLAQPLTPFIADAGGWTALGYLPAFEEAVTFDGDVHGLPFATTIPLLYVNMDLVRRAGYEAVPETWPEIFELAGAISALDDDVMGIYLEYSATSAWMFQSFLMSQGARLMNRDETDIAFDGAEGLQALRWVWQSGEAGQIDMTRSQGRQAFNAGVVGILVRSASGLREVETAADGNFDLQIAQFPIPAEDGVLPGAGNGLVMFADDPERQRAAWAYIAFATGPEGQTIVAENTGYLPTNMIAVEGTDYLADFYAERPNHRLVIERLPVVSDWYAFPGDNSARIFDMMIEEQFAVLRHERSPEEALEAMAAHARALLPD